MPRNVMVLNLEITTGLPVLALLQTAAQSTKHSPAEKTEQHQHMQSQCYRATMTHRRSVARALVSRPVFFVSPGRGASIFVVCLAPAIYIYAVCNACSRSTEAVGSGADSVDTVAVTAVLGAAARRRLGACSSARRRISHSLRAATTVPLSARSFFEKIPPLSAPCFLGVTRTELRLL